MPSCFRASPFSAAAVVAVASLAIVPRSVAHDEWNLLHITNASRTEFVYPFDGRTPKVAASLLNHHEVSSPAIATTLDVNGERQGAAGPFIVFPQGSNLVVTADGFAVASTLTGPIYDGRLGPAPAVGEAKEYTFDFIFRLAPGAIAPPGQVPAPGPTYTQSARVVFTNLGENPSLAGPMAVSGSVRVPALAGPTPAAPTAPTARVEVSTPYSNWFPLDASATSDVTGTTHTFGRSLLSRADWHVRLAADGYTSRVVALGHPNDPRPSLNLALEPAPALDFDFRRSAAITTPTGFWRGAVAEAEGTFVAFPGQETWRSSATDAEARALRASSRIVKYRFDGTRVWEHAPGWETWGGDMTADGRFVVYALNPTAHSFYTPTEHKLVLLDGVTGAIIWTRSGAPNDDNVGRRVDALEVVFSPDARHIAVGSVAAGTVSLVDRATGAFVWTVPGAGTSSFGQIRRLRFSPDGQFLYSGSGDSHIRKLRTSDGAVLWKVYAGGWPFVNGLDLTPDGSWLAAGTRSLDTTVIRTSDGQQQWQRESQSVDSVFAPDGRHLVTAGGQVFRTLEGTIVGMTKTPGVTRFTPDGMHLLSFGAELRLYDLGGNLLRTFEASGIPAAEGQRPQWAHLTADGRYAILLARDMPAPPQTGIVIYERRAATNSAAPTIVAAPVGQTIVAGRAATLLVTASGTGPLSYQWRRNGNAIAGANNPALSIVEAKSDDAGAYTCVVSNSAGSITSSPAAIEITTANPNDPPRLTNLAVRTSVGTAPLIVGFAVGGSGTGGTKPLLIRGAGPALTALGVGNALADPRIELFSGVTSVLSNDNWSNAPAVVNLSREVGAFAFAADSRDAALLASAVGGSYTAQLGSVDNSSGIALAEIYDGSPSFTPATPRLINLSARTALTAAGDTLIAGFVVAGPAGKRVLVRGIGPALAGFGVSGALANPRLSLFRGSTVIASNEDWHDAPNAVAIADVGRQVGAFPLVPGSADAALLLSLPPGSYTAQIAGTAAGSALVEVYDVP